MTSGASPNMLSINRSQLATILRSSAGRVPTVAASPSGDVASMGISLAAIFGLDPNEMLGSTDGELALDPGP